MRKEKKLFNTIFVSSCLLSKKCIYHGFLATFAKERIDQLQEEGFKIVDACPEMLGGLPCPRPAARMREGRLMSGGRDVTDNFIHGSKLAMRIIKKEKPVVALLLKNSPACDPDSGIFGKQVTLLIPTITCHRKNDWQARLNDILKLRPNQGPLFQ